MDIDSSFVEGLAFPPKTDHAPSAPFAAVPGSPAFKNMFYDPSSPPAIRDDLPVYLTKTGQLVSPEAGPEVAPGRRRAGTISIFDGSSPVADSSPSALKLERLANCVRKPMLNGLGAPSDNPAKRLRKPNLSAMVLPSDAAQLIQPLDVSQNDDPIPAVQGQNMGLPPPRRAFSAMLPQLGPKTHSSGESSIDHGDESSPALAYAKRQQIRTIRRRDGTDDFRSLKGATAMVARDKESPRVRMIPQWGTGLGGFGDNEAHGKILPCHRVREDGLMRISCKTVSVFSPRRRGSDRRCTHSLMIYWMESSSRKLHHTKLLTADLITNITAVMSQERSTLIQRLTWRSFFLVQSRKSQLPA
jgi:M-phase inducer tyrosine phosphatase